MQKIQTALREVNEIIVCLADKRFAALNRGEKYGGKN